MSMINLVDLADDSVNYSSQPFFRDVVWGNIFIGGTCRCWSRPLLLKTKARLTPTSGKLAVSSTQDINNPDDSVKP